ncbi:isoprenylcysteine carboxylmethyltransferase family protein [uncultured Paracoccus sp.]|uniref:methyltransferase family protein n=1 Tax=uncultured Paracoccus sp. TaxID=189685 RepID=UPI0025DD1A35|nr:isoprenylcysteine carboxylmethyltransferase family protein [uncultured Paracoccus sp.]
MAPANCISLGILAIYLAGFFWGTIEAARAAGQSVWLFGKASGTSRLAAFGFRAAFVLALTGPILWLAVPMLHGADPLWGTEKHTLFGVIGAVTAATGAALAFAAQMSMGASWRVGVAPGKTGALVTGGLYRISRNPTFLGQIVLLAGVALAVPSLPTALAPVLFLWSASVQIREEERVLRAAHGAAYDAWAARVPRWIGLRREERI